MKKLNTLSLGALIACSAFLSSCEKESDSIAPVAAAKSADANPAANAGFVGTMAPCPVGGYWDNGTEATGILDDNGGSTLITMRLVSTHSTGVGEMNTFVTDVPIGWTSAYGQTHTIEYTKGAYRPYDPNTQTYGAPRSVKLKCITVVDAVGNVQMKVTLNLKKQ